MKLLKKVSIVLVFAMLILTTKSNAATEKIYSYESDIYIQEDSSILVEEKITVYAAGNQIKKGIYRDFPTKYKDKNGNNYTVKFEVEEVLRDGKSENYTTEKVSNGVRVRIGNADTTLKAGYYTYTIKYKTTRQLGYFEDHDELYWNVTGNGWSFVIDEVKATVHLPDGANMDNVKYEAYTGEQGSTEKEYKASKDEYDNTVTFYTTNKLETEEGLTIVVGFDKGLVHEPTWQEKLGYFFDDNKGVLIGLEATVLLAIYCYVTWLKVGRDPKKDVIIPRYNPPENLSPSEVKFIDSMGKYDKVLEASILNLAVKGYIKIENNEKEVFGIKTNKFTLIKQKDSENIDSSKDESKYGLSKDERDVYYSLPDKATLTYSSSLQQKLEKIQNGQKSYLKKKFEGVMYSKNTKYFVLSIIFSIIITMISYALSANSMDTFIIVPFMTVWLGIWSIGIVSMLKSKKGKKKFILALFMLPFLLGEILGIGVLVAAIGGGMTLLIVLLIIINTIYSILIRAYTEEGRRIKDEIEGFKLFIKTASEEEIMAQTPETFDKYFPYAYVLGLENQWAKKFENLLSNCNYEPNWCTGMYVGSSFDATSFTSSFSSSFSSSISSASTAPGSSSGFSGGSSGRRRIIWWWRPEAGGGGGW